MVALEDSPGWNRSRASAIRSLLGPLMKPNLRYDPATTEAARGEAIRQVETAQMEVNAGTTLVQAGERITPQILEMVMAHEQRRGELESPRDRFLKLVARARSDHTAV